MMENLFDPLNIKLERVGTDCWIDRNYGLRIELTNGRYKPSHKGTYLVVGGLYSMEAAKQVCCLILNDQILNRTESDPIPKAA